MPIYEIELDDGRVAEVDADSQELALQAIGLRDQQSLKQAAPKQIKEAPVTPQGTMIDRFAEPARAIASSVGNTVAGGLLGVKESFDPRTSPGAGARAVQESRNASFQPQTIEGQKGMAAAGGMIETIANQFKVPVAVAAGIADAVFMGSSPQEATETFEDVARKGLGKTLGDNTLDATGSPLLATGAQILPEALVEIAGSKGATGAINRLRPPPRTYSFIDERTGLPTKAFDKALEAKGLSADNVGDAGDLKFLPDNTTPKQAVDLILKKKMRDGDKDDALWPYQLDKKGQVEPDLLAQDAVRQGFEGADLQSIKAANPQTKAKMQNMIAVTRRRMVDSTIVERPTTVVGDSVMARFDYISRSASEAAVELKKIADTKLMGKSINLDDIESDFLSEMDRLYISVDRSSIPPKLDFSGSDISKDLTSQKAIQDVVDLLSYDSSPNAFRAHRIKRQLDALVDYRKKDSGGLTDAGKNVIKAMRRSLNNSIRDVDADYARVNDTLSESLGAMEDLDKAVGASINLNAPQAASALGTNLRRLLSNGQTRGNLDNAVSEIDAVARNLGGNFGDDVNSLMHFANTLENRFGIVAKNSFGGQVAAGAKQASRGFEGLKEAAIDKAAEALERSRGINDNSAINTLHALVKRKGRR